MEGRARGEFKDESREWRVRAAFCWFASNARSVAKYVMTESFNFHLGKSIHKGKVVVGTFYGSKPTLAAATTAGRILVHNPHERASAAAAAAAIPGGLSGSSAPESVSYLNINREVTALSAGRLRESEKRDTLFVGSGTSLLAYDVEGNEDLFYREVPDGANAVVIGRVHSSGGDADVAGKVGGGDSDDSVAHGKGEALGSRGSNKSPKGTRPLALVGGNCSIVGFDGRLVVVLRSPPVIMLYSFVHILSFRNFARSAALYRTCWSE